MRPNLKEEKKLWEKGYKKVASLDEVGRGALAGPVVAAAVAVAKLKIKNDPFDVTQGHPERSRTDEKLKIILKGIKDSKQLSPKKREEFYRLITECPYIEWGIGRVSEKIIDKINIKNAAELAMEKALRNLEKKVGRTDFLIIDGNRLKNRKLKTKNHKLIVKADEKVFSCAAASILAKVTRDNLMKEYHRKYPYYGFDRHKGYATTRHLKALRKRKSCVIHRQCFRPVWSCG